MKVPTKVPSSYFDNLSRQLLRTEVSLATKPLFMVTRVFSIKSSILVWYLCWNHWLVSLIIVFNFHDWQNRIDWEDMQKYIKTHDLTWMSREEELKARFLWLLLRSRARCHVSNRERALDLQGKSIELKNSQRCRMHYFKESKFFNIALLNYLHTGYTKMKFWIQTAVRKILIA